MKICHTICASLACLVLGSSTLATLPDNGSGTVDMPLDGDYLAAPGDLMHIIDGLPPGSTIEIDPVLTDPVNTVEESGGTLGGTRSAGDGNGIQMSMQGTGAFSGYTRNVTVPLGGNVASFPSPIAATSGYEVHAGPRTNGNPVQSFDTDMFRMFGQITGDPDFDLLRITGGTDFGLPSPGHTTLVTDGMGAWNVDSFFDITYRIDFVGHNPGPFAGLSGSTTGTIRMVLPEPATLSALAGVGLIALRRRSRT